MGCDYRKSDKGRRRKSISVNKKEKRLQELINRGADTLWQPIADVIFDTYREFDKDPSKCNVVLLIAEHNYSLDFYVHFLEPTFPKGKVYFLELGSSYSLERAEPLKREKIMFIEEAFYGLASRFVPKKFRVDSVRAMLEGARSRRMFLILSGKNGSVKRFRELLPLAFPSEEPEIRELTLKPLS